MQADIDHAKRLRGKVVTAVSTTGASTSSTSSTLFTSNEPTIHPVTAVLGMSHNPVVYVAPNASSVLEATSDSDISGDSF